MIIKLANKVIKHPIEFFIEDALFEEINAIQSKDEVNRRLLSLALKHISKNGYNIGFCNEHKREVTLSDCMKCGVAKGWGKGVENYANWEACKKEHINYQFSPAKILTNKIKDKKLEAKMNDQSEAEKRRDRHTFSEVQKGDARDEFEQQSRDVMEVIKQKESQL